MLCDEVRAEEDEGVGRAGDVTFGFLAGMGLVLLCFDDDFRRGGIGEV